MMYRKMFLRMVREKVAEGGGAKEEAAVTVAARILNEYALENIALGIVKPSDSISLDEYMRILGIDCNTLKLSDVLRNGSEYIDNNGIIGDLSAEDCKRRFFDEKILQTETNFSESYRESLYDIFNKATALPFDNKQDKRIYLPLENEKIKLRKFLIELAEGRIGKGSAVMRYFSRLRAYPFCDVLISPITHRLQVADIYAIECKLTALMLFEFTDIDNEIIYLSKLMKFYKGGEG